jgi:hypothetical protein
LTTTPHRTARLRPILFVLTLLLAFAGVVAVAAPAQAAVDTIEGTVSGPATLSNIPVYLSQELTSATGLIFDTGLGAETTLTDSSGHYEFTAVPVGEYFILIDAGDHWVHHLYSEEVDGATTLNQAVIDLQPGRRISGTVRDAASPFTPIAGVVVWAIEQSSARFIFDWRQFDADAPGGPAPVTGVDGTYSIVVGLDEVYQLISYDANELYHVQSWDHRNGSGGFTPIGGEGASGWPYTPLTGRDFDLLAYADWIRFSVLSENLDGTANVVRVYLDKWDGSQWVQLTSKVTNSNGFANLFGEGDGDYRLRYSRNGVFLAVDSWYEPGSSSWPLFDGGKSVELPGLTTGCACAFDFKTLEVDLVFRNPTSGGGSGTPTRPPSSGPPTFVIPTATTSTPAPTPTPSETVIPGPTTSPGPSESATPAPDPEATADSGFPWWIILIIVLVLGIIIAIIVIARRRRAAVEQP